MQAGPEVIPLPRVVLPMAQSVSALMQVIGRNATKSLQLINCLIFNEQLAKLNYQN